ncbi:arylamine N-acetyltransferase family protein [Neobacillus sp. D3-1R]|uniref:arylamine N-acetyltransferase family protein n=1 Tax=Neobacillus sp. D3-1R TaxID=3445778 RepID=UPI003FA06D27
MLDKITENEMGNEREIDQYLERIKMTGEIKPDFNSLQKIQEHHILAVPFENIDIANNKPIILDIETLFEKIVRSKRGGYCYELNGLLAWFLDNVGFTSTILSGKVSRDNGTFGPEFDHMLILVELEKKYIVDVGFGNFARSPLPLSGEVVTDISGMYRIASNQSSDVYYFQKIIAGQWVSGYEFTLEPRQMQDFNEMNVYQQTSVNSHFTQNLIVSIATAEGRLTISGNSFIETNKFGKKRKQIETNDERNSLLKCYFGMDMY